MQLSVKKVPDGEPEKIIIYCHKLTDSVREITEFIKSRQGNLTGEKEGRQYELPLADICYAEAVDNHTYLYCSDSVYETRSRLYELEEMLGSRYFLRISKSVIVNLMKIEALKPALNSRYFACLKNGEQVIVSRKYVPILRERLKGGAV